MDSFLYLLEKERQREFLREADSYQLVRQVMESRDNSSTSRRTLAWIEQRLTTWGTRLQERYGDMPSQPFVLIGVER